MTIKLDKRSIDRFADRLARNAPKQAREISARALNRTAKGAELLAKKAVKTNMTVRNKWTLGSIKSTRTPPHRAIDKQFVLVGSKQAYMERQEFGGALPQRNGVRRMTTSRGSREGATAYPRKKLAKGRMANRNIRLRARRGGRTGSPGRRAKRAVESARSKGDKFIYMNLGGDKAGLFEVKRNEVVMVHRFMRRRMRVGKNPWLGPTVKKSKRLAPKVFLREMRRAFKI